MCLPGTRQACSCMLAPGSMLLVELRCCQGHEAKDRQTGKQTDRQMFPRLKLTGWICKTDGIVLQTAASGTVVTIDQNAQWLRTTLPVNQSQDQTDTDMYSKLAKKTYHFNSRHDGLVDDVTVG